MCEGVQLSSRYRQRQDRAFGPSKYEVFPSEGRK